MSKTILTADDSASMREMIAFTLSNAGYHVLQANDGVEALARVRETRVDLLITDLNMPNMDGIELIRNVRRVPACKYVPIVMVTTESQPAKKLAGKEAGASGWIVKPFRGEQLVAVVKKLVGE